MMHLPELGRVCSRCHKWKTNTEFVKNKKGPDGYGWHCLPCDRVRVAVWRDKNREVVRTKAREKMRVWRAQPGNQERNRITGLASRERARMDVLRHYGGNPPRCACCGERQPRFLTIDHVNGNGREHRREIGTRSMMAWLRNEGYPPGFQVLCYNCNCGRALNGGACPHQGIHDATTN